MALSNHSVPVRVRALLGSRGMDVSNLRNPRIIALINPALETMAYRVANSPDYRRLQKSFIGEPSNGRLAYDVWAATIIFDLARSSVAEVQESSRTLLTPVDSLQVLFHADLPLGEIYYAQDGTALRFRDANGSLTSYGGVTVSITANYIPTLAQLPSELEGLFINTLAGLLTESQPEGRAMELAHG